MRLDEFYSPEDDQSMVRRKDDTRKAKLTLKQLNKLRKLRDFQRAEEGIYRNFARKMYGNPAGEEGGEEGAGLI